MGKSRIDRLSETRSDTDELRWREILIAALQGFCPPDQYLDHMLNSMERAR